MQREFDAVREEVEFLKYNRDNGFYDRVLEKDYGKENENVRNVMDLKKSTTQRLAVKKGKNLVEQKFTRSVTIKKEMAERIQPGSGKQYDENRFVHDKYYEKLA